MQFFKSAVICLLLLQVNYMSNAMIIDSPKSAPYIDYRLINRVSNAGSTIEEGCSMVFHGWFPTMKPEQCIDRVKQDSSKIKDWTINHVLIGEIINGNLGSRDIGYYTPSDCSKMFSLVGSTLKLETTKLIFNEDDAAICNKSIAKRIAAERKISDEQNMQRQKYDDEITRKNVAQIENDRLKAERSQLLKRKEIEPRGTNEAVIYYDAENGHPITTRPKIKPDGTTYYLSGNIDKVIKDNYFIGKFSPQIGDIYSNTSTPTPQQRYDAQQYLDSVEKPFFAVAIPSSVLKQFQDNARINGFFFVIGTYISNTEITLTDKSKRTIPVFQAKYFDF